MAGSSAIGLTVVGQSRKAASGGGCRNICPSLFSRIEERASLSVRAVRFLSLIYNVGVHPFCYHTYGTNRYFSLFLYST